MRKFTNYAIILQLLTHWNEIKSGDTNSLGMTIELIIGFGNSNQYKYNMAEEQFPELQNKLKNILQILVETIKPKLKTKTQLSELQQLLIDYQNNDELAEIIEGVVKMNQKIQSKITAIDDGKNMIDEEQYQKLQQLLQSMEARLRGYVKNQYQLKLYCQELEAKVKELEVSKNQLVISTKKVILDLKRDNQDLITKIKDITGEKQQISHHHENNKNAMRRSTGQSVEKLPKTIKGSQKGDSSLRSKLEQYQEVIQSIEVSRGRKKSFNQDKDRFLQQIK